MTLNEIVIAIQSGNIIIEGAIAELTRFEYYKQYDNYINTGQYVPIFNYNINNQDIYINITDALSITYPDITSATDWICLNSKNY